VVLRARHDVTGDHIAPALNDTKHDSLVVSFFCRVLAADEGFVGLDGLAGASERAKAYAAAIAGELETDLGTVLAKIDASTAK
jgi:hypothetical protein